MKYNIDSELKGLAMFKGSMVGKLYPALNVIYKTHKCKSDAKVNVKKYSVPGYKDDAISTLVIEPKQGGDSAGGNIAVAVTLMLRDNNQQMPNGALLVYPVLDKSMSTESMKRFTDTPIWDAGCTKIFWEMYLENQEDSQAKYASIMDADSLEGFPKTYIEVAEFVQKACTVAGRFRLYTNTDVIGVELGGSLKNVIAIASGFAHSMNLGDNCSGALLTRGMAEIVRVSIQLGANPSTLYGLSGMGDLIATCSSPLSRNYTVGAMLGQGKKIDDILRELGSVAEGVKTSKAICELAKKLEIDVPVSNAIYEAVYTDITPQDLLAKLMNRKLKEEERYI